MKPKINKSFPEKYQKIQQQMLDRTTDDTWDEETISCFNDVWWLEFMVQACETNAQIRSPIVREDT